MRRTLAILDGPPAVRAAPPRWPFAGASERRWMDAVLRDGRWGWMGEHETAFCSEFAEFLGARHCVCVANGSVALECALIALGVGAGDEVIVPGLTWVATAQAVLDVGADAVFADVDPGTWCLDPAAVERAITPRTRAIVPVHLYGSMCDMDAICRIAARHGLRIIEDVAHQHGSRWRGKAAGTIGDAGTFSFQRSKVLTSGEGGAIVTRSAEVYEAAFNLKHVGWNPDLATSGTRYGHNFRLTEMQAVLLRGGLRRLSSQTSKREESASFLREALARCAPVRVAPRDERVSQQAYYALTMNYDGAAFDGIARETVMKALEAEGVRLFAPYPPAYRNPLALLDAKGSPLLRRGRDARKRYAGLRLPVTERIASDDGLTLPHPWLLGGKRLLRDVVTAFDKVFSQPDALRRWTPR